MAERFAAIDIGSNTFRILIAEPATNEHHTPWHTLFYTHRIIRLGEGLHHSGQLADTAMQRGLAAFAEYAEILDQYDVPAANRLAVATAAMREAGNGNLFRERVLAETGIDIHIIDGESEARMSLSGAGAVLTAATRKDMLLFDIGGGSTEFIRATDQQCHDAISTKMGVVRLVEAHLHTDPPSATDYLAMMAAADTHLNDVEQYWGEVAPPPHLVGTAGTVTTLAATELDLCPYDADLINNHWMSRPAFESLRDRLLAMRHDERQAIRTIEQGRGDLIIAGLAIVETVMNRWHYDGMSIVDAGLLEGAWLTLPFTQKSHHRALAHGSDQGAVRR
ncbi:MAG: Ppx/GppA phosphatase family protein [Mariprofundus sp.]